MRTTSAIEEGAVVYRSRLKDEEEKWADDDIAELFLPNKEPLLVAELNFLKMSSIVLLIIFQRGEGNY